MSNEPIKRVVEQIIDNLRKRGVNVTDAAVLNLDAEQGKEQEAINSFKEAVAKASGLGEINTTIPQIEGKCMCPNCFNYDTFEDVLREEGSIFDENQITLNGRVFDVKYHLSPRGDESFMISSEYERENQSPPLQISDEQLQELLNEAVQKRDFVAAQAILNEIQNRKNKN